MARPRKVAAILADNRELWLQIDRKRNSKFVVHLLSLLMAIYFLVEAWREMETDKIIEKKKGQSVSEIDRIHLDLFSLDNHPQEGRGEVTLLPSAACQLRSLSLSGEAAESVQGAAKKSE